MRAFAHEDFYALYTLGRAQWLHSLLTSLQNLGVETFVSVFFSYKNRKEIRELLFY